MQRGRFHRNVFGISSRIKWLYSIYIEIDFSRMSNQTQSDCVYSIFTSFCNQTELNLV